MAASDLHARVDAWHAALSTLSIDSTDADLYKYTEFLAPTGTFYIAGMEEAPATDRAGAAAILREMLKFWRLKERRVVSRATGEDGWTTITEMDNTVSIYDEDLPLKEIEVVQLDPDTKLVVSFRIYCDGKRIDEAIKRKATA